MSLRSLALLLLLVGSRLVGAEPASPSVEVVRDVVFLAPDRPQRLDLYLPTGPRSGIPAVVWVHGGGWVSGDRARSRERNVGTTLAGWGIAVASISYQLGPDAWPRNLHDVKNAVRFLRSQGAKWGIAPDRLAVAGGSAGGNLALLAAFTADREWEPDAPWPGVSSAVRGVVDFYGPTNHLTRRKTDAAGRATAAPHLGNAEKVFAGGDASNLAALRAASPVTHVRAGLPPVFVTHGDADSTVNFGQSEELVAALAAAGVDHEFVPLPGVGHTYDLDQGDGRPIDPRLRLALRAFLQRILAENPSSGGRSARE